MANPTHLVEVGYVKLSDPRECHILREYFNFSLPGYDTDWIAKKMGLWLQFLAEASTEVVFLIRGYDGQLHWYLSIAAKWRDLLKQVAKR